MNSKQQPAPEHTGSLIRLQTLLKQIQGFHFLVVQHNNPAYRDSLIQLLDQSRRDSCVIDLKKIHNFNEFEAQLDLNRDAPLTHLLNLESLSPILQKEIFKGVNYHREHIARTCSGILVFWMAEPLIREMAIQAADFWAWREQVLDFSLVPEPEKRITGSLVKTVNMHSPDKQHRIREIEHFLADPADHPSLTMADLKHEQGRLFWSTGEYDRAQAVLESAIADYRALDDALACAVTRRDLAKLQADQAIDLLQQQVLPVFRQLNQDVEVAGTMGGIADILQSRGQLDEALKIRETEELPVYE